ncbi:MAG: GNAT family N-acetyltransferase [Candidatus Heimdallarchaeota archaeon]|nr:GNAT family N-acetyltransferase [Candidatus Heimdallarchaeota archaeon]
MLNIKKSINDDITELKKTVLESFVQASLEEFGNENTLPPGVKDGSMIIDGIEKKTSFTIFWENKIVGGIIIELREPENHYLQTLWISPDYQNKGIGILSIEFLETTYPEAISWNLETPRTSTKNRSFYENLGYKKIGEQTFEGTDFSLIEYKKVM